MDLDKLLDEIGFTPGSWVVCKEAPSYYWVVGRTIYDAATQRRVADAYGLSDHGEDDARLIAQSREMLKALIEQEYYFNHPDLLPVIEAATGWTWEKIVKWIEENG